MDSQIHTGRNRTGIAMSPFDIEKMLEADAVLSQDPPGLNMPSVPIREAYLEEADTVGSVPLPLSVKTELKAGSYSPVSDHPTVFIDKLGERLAFERSGVRLYQAMLEKCAMDQTIPGDAIRKLRHFQQEELRHFELLADALRSLGVDPTAQTPGADLVGVESQGLVQAITDPRTTTLQSLHVLLAAEVLDVPGWEDLVALAKALGQDKLAKKFEDALSEEHIHLDTVRAWHSQMTSSMAQKGEAALKRPV